MSDAERDAAFGALDNYRLLYILDSLADGCNTRQIAQELRRSQKTVSKYIYALKHSLGFSNTKEMCREYLIWVEE